MSNQQADFRFPGIRHFYNPWLILNMFGPSRFNTFQINSKGCWRGLPATGCVRVLEHVHQYKNQPQCFVVLSLCRIFAQTVSISAPRSISLGLCLGGFLLSVLLVSAYLSPSRVPPAPGAWFPRVRAQGSPSPCIPTACFSPLS